MKTKLLLWVAFAAWSFDVSVSAQVTVTLTGGTGPVVNKKLFGVNLGAVSPTPYNVNRAIAGAVYKSDGSGNATDPWTADRTFLPQYLPATFSAMGVSVMRYPGGHETSFWHWDDPWFGGYSDPYGYYLATDGGVSTRATRKLPAYLGENLDIDEYLNQCAALQIEPLVGCNLLAGQRWGTYSTAPVSTLPYGGNPVAETVAMLKYCKQNHPDVPVNYIYLDNEVGHGTADGTASADNVSIAGYPQMVQDSAIAFKAESPNVKIIVNYISPPNSTTVTNLVQTKGQYIDLVDGHFYYSTGGVWQQFSRSTYMAQTSENLGGYPTIIRQFYSNVTNAGHPDIKLAVNEWGLNSVGPLTVNTSGQPILGATDFDQMLVMTDMLMMFVREKVEMANLWPSYYPGGKGNVVDTSSGAYRLRTPANTFQLFKEIQGQGALNLVSSATDLLVMSALQNSDSTTPGATPQLTLLLLSKNSASSRSVTVDLGAFKARSVTGFSYVEDTTTVTDPAIMDGHYKTQAVSPVLAGGKVVVNCAGLSVTKLTVDLDMSPPEVDLSLNHAPIAKSVAVTGAFLQGQTLTGAYSYADIDGDPQGVSNFRWLRSASATLNGAVAIPGATTTTYTLQAADQGQYLFFEVTPVAGSGVLTGTPVVSSVVSDQAPVASNVTISGTVREGQLLTGVYNYTDAESSPQGTSTFRWLRSASATLDGSAVAIAGATASAYTAQVADVGKYLYFEVTPVATTGNTTGLSVTSSATAAVGCSTYTGFQASLNWGLANSSPSGDPDGDGTSNLQEYAAGTNPLQAADQAPMVASVLTANTYTTLVSHTFNGTPGLTLNGTAVGGGSLQTGALKWVTDGTTAITADGVVTAPSLSRAAYVGLGSSIVNGYTYELAATLAKPTGGIYLGFGFFDSATPTVTSRMDSTLAYGTGWFLWRTSPANIESSIGLGYDGSSVGYGISRSNTLVSAATQTFTIKLDLTAANGTSNWGNMTVYQAGNSTALSGKSNVAFTGTQHFRALGLSTNGANSTISSLSLRQIFIPALYGQGKATQDYLAITYRENTAATDLTYIVQQSSDLSNWTTVTPGVGEIIKTPLVGTTLQLVEVRAPLSAGAQYVRVLITSSTAPASPVASAPVSKAMAAPTAASVSIVGTPAVGQVLAGLYTYADVNGRPEGCSTYRWLRSTNSTYDAGDTVVATTPAYTVKDADAGQYLFFEVTPVAFLGTTVGLPVASGASAVPQAATATISIAATTPAASEPASAIATATNGVFTVTRSGTTTGTTTVNLAIAGTATNGTDYTTLANTVTFNAGETSKTITVTPLWDTLVEGDETVVATVVAGSGYTVAASPTNTATVTISDYQTGALWIEATSPSASEVGPVSGTFMLKRNSTGTALTVNVALSGIAINGTDYTLVRSGSVTLTGTSVTVPFTTTATSRTLTITPTTDGLAEGLESMTATIMPGSGYTVGTSSNATVTITDAELATVAIVATDPTATEGMPVTDTGTLTLTRSGAATGTLTVNLTYAGTATAAVDYTASPATVTFAPGETTKTLTVTPIDDTLVEGSETVVATLAPGTDYVADAAPNNTATVTIVDNETAVVAIAASDASATEPLTGPATDTGTFTVSRSGAATGTLTVNLTYAGTASNGTDYTALPASVTFAGGETTKTLTVSPLSDGLVEGNEMVVAMIAAGTGYTSSVSPNASAMVTITDATPPYEAWLSGFTFAPGANQTPTGDPDGDGLFNLVEYALGLSPTAANANPITLSQVVVNGSTYLQLSVNRNPAVTNVLIEGLSAGTLSDPAAWSTGTTVTVSDTESVFTVRDNQPIETNNKCFLRLRFTLTP